MKKLMCLTAFMSFNAVAQNTCDLESIVLSQESEVIEQHFYTGTCHYRNKDYSLAVRSWEKVASIQTANEESKILKIDVLNNLGFMKFFGYGTEVDKAIAVDMWKEAISLGHNEAEYHLCHAYADKKEPTFEFEKAKRHCLKARLIYKNMERKDDEILSQIESYLKSLGVAVQ